jgi:hypothetical protein
VSALPCPACDGARYVVDYVSHDRGLSSGQLEICGQCNGSGVDHCWTRLACASEVAVGHIDGFPACQSCIDAVKN